MAEVASLTNEMTEPTERYMQRATEGRRSEPLQIPKGVCRNEGGKPYFLRKQRATNDSPRPKGVADIDSLQFLFNLFRAIYQNLITIIPEPTLNKTTYFINLILN